MTYFSIGQIVVAFVVVGVYIFYMLFLQDWGQGDSFKFGRISIISLEKYSFLSLSSRVDVGIVAVVDVTVLVLRL